jgi:hypothetical protein
MTAEILTLSLEVGTFSLDFRVSLDASIESTKSFQPAGVEGFVFAVGEIWLRATDASALLVEEASAGNLIETLRTLERRVATMRPSPELEQVIPVGGWSRWMAGYWERLNADRGMADDEKVYDLLAASLVADGKAGYIAAYQHGRVAVIEACTRPTVGNSMCLSSVTEPSVFCESVRRLSRELCQMVRARI